VAEFLRVKNWEQLQHYKDRSPPWIKLHRELLRDYEFSCLQDASKLHLMLIWLLASQLDNKIPNDPAWIQRQIGCEIVPDLKPLIDIGFLILEQDASRPLATCKQVAMLETEAETEKEKTYGSSATPPNPAADQFAELWKIYPKRSGSNPKDKAFSAYQARLKEKANPDEIKAGLQRYRAWCEGTGKIGTETVMQASRFFGTGREWEQAWEPPAEKLKLPWDNRELWKIRAAIGMDAFYDGDPKDCHAEILAYLQTHPEQRHTVQSLAA